MDNHQSKQTYKDKAWLELQRSLGKNLTVLAKECGIKKGTLKLWTRRLGVLFKKDYPLRDKPRYILTGKTINDLLIGDFVEYKIYGTSRAAVYKYSCKCGYESQDNIHFILKKKLCPKCSYRSKGFSARKHKDTMFSLLLIYKTGAKNRNLKWNLTDEQFREITSSNCYYCGQIPKSIHRSSTKNISYNEYIYNGVDRKDNKKGYFVKNCVPCCTICNLAKRNLSIEDFKSWIKQLVLYNKHLLDQNKPIENQ